MLKKLLAIFIVLLLFSCSAEKKQLTIIHFSDVELIKPSKDGTKGGASRVASLINRYKKENPLIIFSGDTFGGSFTSLFLKGKQKVGLFNYLGVDFAVTGNHDFDFGYEVAKKRFKESKFKWIVSNLVDSKTGKPLENTAPWAMVEWNGIKVGLVGLVENWITSTSPGPRVKYLDFVTQGKKWVKFLKSNGSEIIIAMTHMELENDKRLATNVPEIDFILGGHDHVQTDVKVGHTLIWKSGARWRKIGLLQVKLSEKKILVQKKILAVNETVKKDKNMIAVLKNYQKEFTRVAGTKVNKVIGKSNVALDVLRKTVRTRESNFGNFVADALREYAHTDIAFTNGGGLRSNTIYTKGDITFKEIGDIMPFGNKVVSLQMTGREIKKALENGLSHIENRAGGFLQVSGVKFKYSKSLKSGNRILEVLIGKTPLQPQKKYTVATNDYIARGGNDFNILKTLPRIINENNGKMMLQIVIDKIRKEKVISPKLEKRIVQVP